MGCTTDRKLVSPPQQHAPGGRHARSRHRRDRPHAHRAREQGVTRRLPSRRPVGTDHPLGAGQGSGARPRAGRRHHLGLWSARRRGRLQRRPGRGDHRRRRRARRDRQPLLLVVAADHPHGRARDQGRRGRRVHRRWCRDRQPVPLRRGRQRWPEREVRNGARPYEGTHRGWPAAVDAARGSPGRVHRHGSDRGERRRGRRCHARRDGRVGRALAAARGRSAGERLLRSGDHAGDDAGRHGRDEGRRAARGHDGREARDVAAGVPTRTARSRRATRAR